MRNVGLTKATLFVATTLFLAACSSNSALTITPYKPEVSDQARQQRQAFVGKWRSEQATDDGGHRIANIHRNDDGRYLIEFQLFNAQQQLIDRHVEFGFWGVAGGIYFTFYQGDVEHDELIRADSRDPYNYNSYQIIEVSADSLRYRSLTSGNLFHYFRTEETL